MKRVSFLKKLFAGGAAAIVAPNLLANDPKMANKEFSFNEIFIVHDGNNRLIYPKKESIFYQQVFETFKSRLDLSKHHTYLPVHSLSIPVKDVYMWEDFLPIKYYFECVYGEMQKYTTEGYGVCYRFIKDKLDRMHLEVFLAY